MKSYFSNPNMQANNMGGPRPINVSASHQELFLGNTISSMNPLNAPLSLGSSQHRTGIKMIQEHHQSMRKATAEQQTAPANSSSPKNIIVKTNKFLFKNLATEPQRAPKGDMGRNQQLTQASLEEKKSLQMPTKMSQKNLRAAVNMYQSPYQS